ncbi:hypothetical protein IPG41_02450 [Candidatus Peregrinibacteria bacterium]|nr:MAG: hypothetical protein IPG41_02450 [Candidatus Peregrinibacteria bacterium]
MKNLTFLVLATLALTACSSGQSKTDQAGIAMAQVSCLLFDESVTFDQITQKSDEFLKEQGWESLDDFDAYLSSIKGTADAQAIKTAALDSMSESCKEGIAEVGGTPEEFMDAMLEVQE